MASNSPLRNPDEEKLDLKEYIESGLFVANPTSEELDARREQQIQALPEPENSTGPKTESTPLPGGGAKETVLIYYEKSEHDSKPYKMYKTRLCDHYNTPGGCKKGGACKFAHGEAELKRYTFMWNKYHDQANIKKPHQEPCRNQQCPIKLRSLLYKTVICKYWEENRCNKSADSCDYAHGDAERNPLPKYEMCQNYDRGNCDRENTECVYAHSENEKREMKKDRKQKPVADKLCTPCQRLYDDLPDADLRNKLIG